MNNFVGPAEPPRMAYLNVGQLVMNPARDGKGVFLDVHPVTPANLAKSRDRNVVYNVMKPVIVLMKVIGILPIEMKGKGKFRYLGRETGVGVWFNGSFLGSAL